MHQTHKIPWKLLTPHFRIREPRNAELQRLYIEDHARVTSSYRYKRTPLITDQVESTDNYRSDLAYFVKCFVSSIKEFSETERKKYPPVDKLPILYANRSKVVSEESFAVLEHASTKYGQSKPWNKFLNPIIQTTAYWRDFNQRRGEMAVSDVLKLLIQESDGLALLSVAHVGPETVRAALHYGQSHEQGWMAIVVDALRCYLFLNLIYTYEDGALIPDAEYTRLDEYGTIVLMTCGQRDAGSHVYENLRFWIWQDPITETETVSNSEVVPQTCAGSREVEGAAPDHYNEGRQYVNGKNVFADLQRTREYVKKCFRILYVADMLMTELNIEPHWEYYIMCALRGYGLPAVDPQSINPNVKSVLPRYIRYC